METKKDFTESRCGGTGHSQLHVMITACAAYVHVCILLPLDTQRQYDAIMTLEGFLTLVGGAGVPYLRGINIFVKG